ncbi:CHRD domain-containing protein [Streptomyces sp. NPDC058955]|uniref:CHRD domain-containing protein n=1 Tax=unclassified Streptomyces TaxID=2593676 RepID=UPI003668B01D
MRRLTPVVAAVIALAGLTGTTPATADGGSGAGGSREGQAPAAGLLAARAPAVSLMARLTGDQGVPEKSGTATGDRDGRAIALVKVKGDRVTFALSWNGVDVPARAHLRRGGAGAAGAAVAELFTTPMPASVSSAAGQTSVSTPALAELLRRDPDGFYVDLRTEAFPGGAVRGQLRPLGKPVNPLSVIRGGRLRALADGGQEVPAGAPDRAGDPDGHSTTFLHPRTDRVDYSLVWVNTGPPLSGHVHEGALGENGALRLPLFVSPVPKNIFGISGSVSAPDASFLARLKEGPTGFYANLPTREFPEGAVRGQLFR